MESRYASIDPFLGTGGLPWTIITVRFKSEIIKHNDFPSIHYVECNIQMIFVAFLAVRILFVAEILTLTYIHVVINIFVFRSFLNNVSGNNTICAYFSTNITATLMFVPFLVDAIHRFSDFSKTIFFGTLNRSIKFNIINDSSNFTENYNINHSNKKSKCEQFISFLFD